MGPGSEALLMQMEAKGYVGRTLDTIDADFPVTLRCVSIAGGKERPSFSTGR